MHDDYEAPDLFSFGSPTSWCLFILRVQTAIVLVDMLAVIGCPHGTYPSEGKVVVSSTLAWSGYVGMLVLVLNIALLFARTAPFRTRLANLLLSTVAAAAGQIPIA